MRQSRLFTKTRREAPKDEVSKNAALLIRAGYINKEMAGAYSYLPLGLRTFNKIVGIIREEMNALGGQEISMTALQEPEIWKKSGRWDDSAVDIWFKSELKAGGEIGFANTHEEPLTRLLTQHVSSHKDLPLYIYQFQTKFRNELRAKSGIMRTREFVMKDLYSFSRTEEEFEEFYERCAEAYMRIFSRAGIDDRTYRAFASGGSFSKYSHEFQTISDAGEDIIHISEEDGKVINAEVYDEDILVDLNISGELRAEKSIEVGNIFPLGTRFSEALGLRYKDTDGELRPVIMGSYGIGPGRLMGTVAEVLSDESGLVWPESISPFQVHIVLLNQEDGEVRARADALYTECEKAGIEALYDDRDTHAGEKFADSDLVGIPFRIVMSKKNVHEEAYEIVDRRTGESAKISREAFFTKFGKE